MTDHIGDAQAGAPGAGRYEDGQHAVNGAMIEWAARAAASGMSKARHAMADHAWAAGDFPAFLRWALPVARELAQGSAALDPQEAGLLSRVAQVLAGSGDFDARVVVRFWERAAQANDGNAQYSLGLWYARMDAGGKRSPTIPGPANYRKAICWLARAGEQGLAQAWYALSRIHLRAECSRRNVAEARMYLERSAEAGHAPAQLELGVCAWRSRRVDESGDVRAVYWLQRAAAQGSVEAKQFMERIAACTAPAAWACAALQRLTHEAALTYPFLVARVELAASFGLSRQEAMLLDPKLADCGHCLLVDVRAHHARGKRRLILIQTNEERQVLDRTVRMFEHVDCGPDGPEGNYRQRLYRLRTLLS